MKKISLLFLALLGFSTAFAQLGFSGKYTQLYAPGWKDLVERDFFSSSQVFYPETMTTSVDFAFELEKTRIVFVPEAALGIYNLDFRPDNLPPNTFVFHRWNTALFSLGLNTHLYLLDLKKTSDTPIYLREESVLKKGLFLRAGLGWQYANTNYNVEDFQRSRFSDANAVQFNVGLGLDLWAADFFKISPMIEIRYADLGQNWFGNQNVFFDDVVLIDVNGEFIPNEFGPPMEEDLSGLSTAAIQYLFGLRMEVQFKK